MATNKHSFNQILISHWEAFIRSLKAPPANAKLINGENLDIACVVASSRYGSNVGLDENALQRLIKGAEVVHGALGQGEIIYGVSTGFGGNSDVRTAVAAEMSAGLMRGLHYGILSDQKPKSSIYDENISSQDLPSILSKTASLQEDPHSATTMPESWVRGSMIIRANSLAGGASGVRPIIVQTILDLLNKDVVPRIPLRGSISASGDLSPLSYIGGVMQGKPAVQAHINGRNSFPQYVRADEALSQAQIKPVKLAEKEGLALVNGTAASASVGALAIHDAMLLALLSQILTAMSVEALLGTDESFNPFFAKVRPHIGQIESAENILAFLTSSKLVQQNDGSKEFSQRQDRYSIRTASQWIGPVLEDLASAHKQITIELNSVTDNPLFDGDKVLHGGNFQAKCVTTAMEKTRQGVQSLGQMLFAQCTELINPVTNRGLAPNLVVDEPNESWMWKGTDIMIAALQSELGFLANPVGNHVQSAEMGNQALNSLALISARYTHTALEVLSQLAAAHLVALCQALDLRAIDISFRDALFPEFKKSITKFFSPHMKMQEDLDPFRAKLWAAFIDLITATTQLDSPTRFKLAIESLHAGIINSLEPSVEMIQALKSWTTECCETSTSIYRSTKAEYLANPDATPILGLASKRMYLYVRNVLKVPFFGDKMLKPAEWDVPDEFGRTMEFTSMGGMITAVYDAIRSGALFAVGMECLQDASGKVENNGVRKDV
ncbi:phenylalanine ammonia-lyase-like protein [Halenospora varia]|nr:phenylalanine ammonia-lyase-like protein [Halenospora varia]